MRYAQTGRWPGQTATVAGALDPPTDRYVKPGWDAPPSAASDEIVRSALWDCSPQDYQQWSLSQLQPRLARGQNPAGNSLKTCAGWRAFAPAWHRLPARSTDIAKQPGLPTPLPTRVWLPIVEDVLWPALYSFSFNWGLASLRLVSRADSSFVKIICLPHSGCAIESACGLVRKGRSSSVLSSRRNLGL